MDLNTSKSSSTTETTETTETGMTETTESIDEAVTVLIDSESSETEVFIPGEAATVSESGTGYDAEIVYQIQVTNNLIGLQIALEIFLLALFLFVIFGRIIKDTITNFIT